MGFGKFLIGAGCVVGGVILAPVVVPVAVAGIGTAAAAAGTAIGGVATAAASTSLGTAAIGAMSTVGSAVGSVAGAVGLSAVATATGTSAGAAAVGTIATSGAIGVSSAASGAKKMYDASETKSEAEHVYDEARKLFDKEETTTNSSLEKLGKTKLESWNNLKEYVESVDKITNIEFRDDLKIDGELHLDKNALEGIRIMSFTIVDTLKGSAAAITGGQLVGLATSTGFTSIATASTGTAIAGLHGAAATNASLAALGGGSLAAGGGGMALGSAVASALSFAPAIAIGGLFINSKGKKNLKNAENLLKEAEALEEEFEAARKELGKLKRLSNKVNKTLISYNVIFDKHLDWIKEKVKEETDYRKYDENEKALFRTSFQLACIIKNLACAELMDSNNNIMTKNVNELIKVSDECISEKVV